MCLMGFLMGLMGFDNYFLIRFGDCIRCVFDVFDAFDGFDVCDDIVFDDICFICIDDCVFSCVLMIVFRCVLMFFEVLWCGSDVFVLMTFYGVFDVFLMTVC